MPVVISQHLLNVFVQLANKRGLKKYPKRPLYVHNFVVLDCVIFSHQLYSYIILTDSLRLQIIVFSILYMIYLKMAYV
jgi:hypothetical protein